MEFVVRVSPGPCGLSGSPPWCSARVCASSGARLGRGVWVGRPLPSPAGPLRGTFSLPSWGYVTPPVSPSWRGSALGPHAPPALPAAAPRPLLLGPACRCPGSLARVRGPWPPSASARAPASHLEMCVWARDPVPHSLSCRGHTAPGCRRDGTDGACLSRVFDSSSHPRSSPARTQRLRPRSLRSTRLCGGGPVAPPFLVRFFPSP